MMASQLEQVQTLDTGLFIDRICSIPFGSITEVWGDGGVGKSSLVLQIIAEAQKQGKKCLWADAEYSYDARYAASLGVDNGALEIIRDKVAEDLLDSLEGAIARGGYDLVVLDSIGALTPRQEFEKGVGEKSIGGQAGLVSRFCRKVVPSLYEHKTALIVINHSFVDIMSGALKTSGGRKLEYHKSLSIRLKVKNGPNNIVQGGQKIGKVITAIVIKDKILGHIGAEIDGHLIYGAGFSKQADLLEEAIRKGVIEKRGQTYFFGEEKLGRIGTLRERLKTDENLISQLTSRL